ACLLHTQSRLLLSWSTQPPSIHWLTSPAANVPRKFARKNSNTARRRRSESCASHLERGTAKTRPLHGADRTTRQSTEALSIICGSFSIDAHRRRPRRAALRRAPRGCRANAAEERGARGSRPTHRDPAPGGDDGDGI